MISRSLEALLYRNHEERIASMRGSQLPKDNHAAPGTSDDSRAARAKEAAIRAETKRAQLAAIRRGREAGVTGAELARQVGITERRLYWLQRELKLVEGKS